ncbi:MAG: DUF2252 family protein [Burkholderiales bacterium]
MNKTDAPGRPADVRSILLDNSTCCQVIMGKGATFDEVIADFSEAYADQNEKDHAALLKAVRSSRLKAIVER